MSQQRKSRGGAGKAPSLFVHCTRIYETFKSTTHTSNVHCDQYIVEHGLSKPRGAFLREVFTGLLRYKKALKVVLSCFLFRNAGEAIRADSLMYFVLSYLTMFRLREMGLDSFCKMIHHIPRLKVYNFLSFLTDETVARKWLASEWVGLYDVEFVETKMVVPLVENGEILLPYLRHLQTQVSLPDSVDGTMGSGGVPSSSGGTYLIQDGLRSGPSPILSPPDTYASGGLHDPSTTRGLSRGASRGASRGPSRGASRSGRPLTMSKGPILTRPRERVVYEEEEAEVPSFYRPSPGTTYTGDIEFQEKMARAKRNRKPLTVPMDDPLGRKARERTSGGGRARQRSAAKNKTPPRPAPIKARPVPVAPESPPVVRLNAATIMREEALYRQRQEEQAAQFKEYEAGLHDSRAFDDWQAEQRALDDAERLAAVERRRLEAIIARDEAIAKKNEKIEMNRGSVRRSKEEAVRRAVIREKKAAVDRKAAELRVQRVASIREGAIRARGSASEEKRSAAISMKEEQRLLVAEAWERQAQEDAARQARIREIQALEMALSGPQEPKPFDVTQTAGSGLMVEMSIAEMRERLALNREREERERAERHEEIQSAKTEQANSLQTKLTTIARARATAQAKARRAKHEKERARKEAQEARLAARDLQIVELQAKLAAKREKRYTDNEELREESKKAQRAHLFRQSQALHGEMARSTAAENMLERATLNQQRQRLADNRQKSKLQKSILKQRRINQRKEDEKKW